LFVDCIPKLLSAQRFQHAAQLRPKNCARHRMRL
jgi:hypothetical protein